MADITDQHEQTSPTELDDHTGNGTGETRGVKRPRPSAADDDDDDDEKGGRERRKIEIKFIADKSRRHITFSKRKAGIMKKVRRSRQLTCLRSQTDWRSCLLHCGYTGVIANAQTDLMLTSNLRNRPTSCPSSLVHRCYCSSCRRLASSTLSQRRSFSRSSPRPRERI